MKPGLPRRIAFGVLPVVASLLITSVLILLVGSSPVEVFKTIFEGAFRNSNAFASVINFWIPLTLVSIGLTITFSAGLWNIGAEGQVIMGALFASWAARTFVLPSPIMLPLEVALAALGGALWGFVVGILRTRFGVHEIFGGVGLNAIASVFAIYLISGPWQPPEGGGAQATAPFPDYALIPDLSPELPIGLFALIILIVSIFVVYFALRGTRWGLELKATGKNPRSALLLGVPTTRVMLSAFMACGALAGIAGSYRVLFTYDSLRQGISGGIGYLGVLIVLLIGARPLWVPVISFLFAAILAGSTRLRISLQLDQSLAGILQGTLVLIVLLSNGLRQRLLERGQEKPVPPQQITTTMEMRQPTVTTAPTETAHE
jgi:simple sugar transport system permease protein